MTTPSPSERLYWEHVAKGIRMSECGDYAIEDFIPKGSSTVRGFTAYFLNHPTLGKIVVRKCALVREAKKACNHFAAVRRERGLDAAIAARGR